MQKMNERNQLVHKRLSSSAGG